MKTRNGTVKTVRIRDKFIVMQVGDSCLMCDAEGRPREYRRATMQSLTGSIAEYRKNHNPEFRAIRKKTVDGFILVTRVK